MDIMTDKKIEKMLSDILNEVDYDIWKSYFSTNEESDEEYDENECDLEALVAIVKKHLK